MVIFTSDFKVAILANHFIVVDDEGHAASFIQSDMTEQVTVWNVDGAHHTGGYDAQPAEWQQHVVEFLDESLN